MPRFDRGWGIRYTDKRRGKKGGAEVDIQLIAIRLERPFTEEETARLLQLVPTERRVRLANLRDPVLGQEPICAYAALQLGLNALYGWRELPELAYNKYGKPEFAAHPEVQFNISHTRGAVLVGIHDQPIGVDIERIRPVSERTMQRLAGAATQREFFESWTRRESRGKWGGVGLAAMRREASPTMFGERFEYVDTFPGYVACVCTHSNDPLAKVHRFTLGDIT